MTLLLSCLLAIVFFYSMLSHINISSIFWWCSLLHACSLDKYSVSSSFYFKYLPSSDTWYWHLSWWLKLLIKLICFPANYSIKSLHIVLVFFEGFGTFRNSILYRRYLLYSSFINLYVFILPDILNNSHGKCIFLNGLTWLIRGTTFRVFFVS